MNRKASVSRKTKETEITVHLDLDGKGKARISTGIPFFDHMLTAFAVHGFFDLEIEATGDLEVDFHHTVEDVGLVLGQALSDTLDKKEGLVRFGDAGIPMDEALSRVTIDLSGRPYLIYNFPEKLKARGPFDAHLANEFFRAMSTQGGFNLHINTLYGQNEHHVLESMFKALGKSLHLATRINDKIIGALSSKGSL